VSSPTYQACACGGTVVVIPARPGAAAETEHRDAEGNVVSCPNAS
jgi:hypothetical protein